MAPKNVQDATDTEAAVDALKTALNREEPTAGSLVVDTARDLLGYVMGHEGPYVQLRPVAGGREWDADPAQVRRATDEERLRAVTDRTRAMNSFSSGGIFR
ncbi:hypothetical protein AB0M11_24395 [Streptomyces sp. NPDC051987]|uniref:hypothetical protein n=1 Tax=Streptomyces sp. NPDC051987 TaxID=3155808 RepID=UPI00341B0122